MRGVSGKDLAGNLDIQAERTDSRTNLSTRLNKEVTGKDNTTSFSLSYIIEELAKKEGNIWSLLANKIETREKIESYSVKILVPVSFGSVFSAQPNPDSVTQNGGQTILTFGKDSLSYKGISAKFGDSQQIHFKYKVPLENLNFFKKNLSMNLPLDTDKQQVLISKIDPLPEEISLDQNGNYVATFRVAPKSLVEVQVEGVVGLVGKSSFPNPKIYSQQELENSKEASRFVQTQDKLIQEKAKELKNPRDIYNFVTSNFSYDFEALKSGVAERKGAATILRKGKAATNLDFVDLFVALAKATGLPAREVFGVALSNDQTKRPTFIGSPLNTQDLHVWAQIYDSSKKTWVDIDPTWGSTSGEEYFGKELADRFVLLFSPAGEDLESLKKFTELGNKIESNYAEGKVDFSPKIDFSLKTDQVFAGFPVTLIIDIDNKAGVSLIGGKVNLVAEGLTIVGEKEVELPIIFPYEKKTFRSKIRSGSLFDTTKGMVKAKLEGKSGLEAFKISRENRILVKPFFSLGGQQILLLLLISLLLIGVFTARVKRPKRS